MTDSPSRRALLGALAATPFTGFLAHGAAGEDWLASIQRYWESLARPDGGYGWPDNPHACLTVTYAAIACYRLLGQAPPRKSALAEFLRGAYPMPAYRLKTRPLHRFDYEQMQSLAWLGEPLDSFRDQAAGWVKPSPFDKYYEFDGNPVLQQETGAILSRKLLGLPPTPEWRDYVNSRRRPNGSFNNTPAADGSDGHVVNSLWGLLALGALGEPLGKERETADWIRSCQLPSGGFTYAPHAEIAAHDHVAYTWAALQALQLLKSTERMRTRLDGTCSPCGMRTAASATVRAGPRIRSPPSRRSKHLGRSGRFHAWPARAGAPSRRRPPFRLT